MPPKGASKTKPLGFFDGRHIAFQLMMPDHSLIVLLVKGKMIYLLTISQRHIALYAWILLKRTNSGI